MPVSLVNTGVTFPDNITQQTAYTVPPGGHTQTRFYTSPAVWTKPSGLKAVSVTIVGGGGGGAGAKGAPGPSEIQGGGGGAGGFCGGGGDLSGYILAPLIPGPLNITVGAAGTAGSATIPSPTGGTSAGGTGGTSSFGPLISCTGGAAGGAQTGTGSGAWPLGPGGAGGTATISPTLTPSGGVWYFGMGAPGRGILDGDNGSSLQAFNNESLAYTWAASGGSSFLGYTFFGGTLRHAPDYSIGLQPVPPLGAGAGVAALQPIGGAGGGGGYSANTTAFAGGTGGAGFVEITEYY